MQTVSTERRADWTPPAPRGPRPINFHRLSDVEPEEVQWLWYPYIPAAKLTLIEGDPGQGKSFMTAALAADLSAGRKLPGMKEALPPQRILMLSAEDGLGDTIRPRVEAMNGNMQNIFVSDDYFILDEIGIKEMEELMKTTAATIVFMDPIVAYMGAKVDMHRANEVRGLMTALSDAAKRTGTAVVAVRHLRKAAVNGGKTKAIYSGIGSIDFTAAVRSVLQVQETQSGKKFMYHAKHNLTPKGASLAYSIGEDGAFHWEGELSEDEAATRKGAQPINRIPKAVADAQRFLYGLLRDGPQPSALVHSAAAERGISEQALNRAKPGFVYSYKEGQIWLMNLREREGLNGHIHGKPGDLEIDKLVAEALARRGLNG